jgi:hypothetical protein
MDRPRVQAASSPPRRHPGRLPRSLPNPASISLAKLGLLNGPAPVAVPHSGPSSRRRAPQRGGGRIPHCPSTGLDRHLFRTFSALLSAPSALANPAVKPVCAGGCHHGTYRHLCRHPAFGLTKPNQATRELFRLGALTRARGLAGALRHWRRVGGGRPTDPERRSRALLP